MPDIFAPLNVPGPSRMASAHFSWAELACHDQARTPYPLDYRTDATKLLRLLKLLETIRTQVCGDTALMLNSCYRTQQHNRAIGGAAESQHVLGTAADVVAPALTIKALFAGICALATRDPTLMVRYIKGYRPRSASHPTGPRAGWVHVDVGTKCQPAPIIVWED